MLQVKKLHSCGISAIFFQCCFMIETQILMTVSDFLGFFSRNHFLEGDFTFQWGGGEVGCFSAGGFIFTCKRGCPMRGIGFDGGFLKKRSQDGGATPLLWETLKKVLHFEGGTYFDLNVKLCRSYTNIHVIFVLVKISEKV